MLKKRLSLFLTFVTLLLSLTGCGSAQTPSSGSSGASGSSSSTSGSSGAASGGKVTDLDFYYPTQVGGALAKGMENIVSEFNKSHPEINVTAVYTGSYKQTSQKAMSDLAAGKGPNVILSGMLDIPDYYNVNKLEDLTPLINKEDKDWSDDFVDGFWGNFAMADGGTYGLPFQHSVCVLYYNKDLLDAAGVSVPTTWDGIIDAEAKLRAHDKKIVPIEFPSDVWVLEALTLSDSGSLIRGATETAFDSQPAVDSLDLLGRLIKGGGMINSYSAAGEDFVAGSCAMTFNTTGNLGFAASDAKFNWDVAMVPVKTTPGFSYGGGGMIMTAGQTDAQKAASWEFMKYMTSPEVSAKWMTISGYFPVRKSADNLQITKDYYTAHPQMKHAAALLKYTTSQWYTNNYWDVYDCMQTALDSVLVKGAVSAKDALTKAQTDAMKALSKKK